MDYSKTLPVDDDLIEIDMNAIMSPQRRRLFKEEHENFKNKNKS